MEQTISTADAEAGRDASNKRWDPARSRSAAVPSKANLASIKTVKSGRLAVPRAKDAGAKRTVPATGRSTKRGREPRSGTGEQRRDLSALKALLVEPRRQMTEHQTFAARSQKSLAGALSATLELCRTLTTNPPALWDLCVAENIWLTAATKKAPCLAVLKLVAPTLEVKTASLYGKVLAHALGSGLDADGLRTALINDGIVELARQQVKRCHRHAAALTAPALPDRKQSAARDASLAPSRSAGGTESDPAAPKRTRQERGTTAPAAPAQSRDQVHRSLRPEAAAKYDAEVQTSKADVAAQLRKRQKPVLLRDIEAPPRDGFVLVIAEVLGGNLFAYDLDIDPTRVEASARAALRRASLLRRRAEPEDTAASFSGGRAPDSDETHIRDTTSRKEITA